MQPICGVHVSVCGEVVLCDLHVSDLREPPHWPSFLVRGQWQGVWHSRPEHVLLQTAWLVWPSFRYMHVVSPQHLPICEVYMYLFGAICKTWLVVCTPMEQTVCHDNILLLGGSWCGHTTLLRPNPPSSQPPDWGCCPPLHSTVAHA